MTDSSYTKLLFTKTHLSLLRSRQQQSRLCVESIIKNTSLSWIRAVPVISYKASRVGNFHGIHVPLPGNAASKIICHQQTVVLFGLIYRMFSTRSDTYVQPLSLKLNHIKIVRQQIKTWLMNDSTMDLIRNFGNFQLEREMNDHSDVDASLLLDNQK